MAITISRTDLARHTRAVVEQVQRGQPVVVQGDDLTLTLRACMEQRINLGKAAEQLGLSRFELMERFERLGIPLRIGPATLEKARAEVETARQGRGVHLMVHTLADNTILSNFAHVRRPSCCRPPLTRSAFPPLSETNWSKGNG
jgi:hypothetical protein